VRNKLKQRHISLFFRLSLYIGIIIVFTTIPCSLVEQRSICLIYNLWGIQCITCGITRGVSNFFHGYFIKAWEFNPLTYVVVFLFFILLFSDLYLLFRVISKKEKTFYSIFEYIWKWIFK